MTITSGPVVTAGVVQGKSVLPVVFIISKVGVGKVAEGLDEFC